MGVIENLSRAVAAEKAHESTSQLRHSVASQVSELNPWSGEATVSSVLDRLTGLGPIQALVDDPAVSDVLVNAPQEVWVDRGKGLELSEVEFDSHEDVVATVERAIQPLGLRIDRASPMVEARLPGGSRLHAVLPPASVDGPLIAIRRFTQRLESLDDLVASDTATRAQVSELREIVRESKNVVVSGGTGAGKTTLLNLLAAHIGSNERVVTVEDAAELRLPGHVVRLEARPANAEGAGAITIRDLVRTALRLRPDRIVIGEVRGAEAFDLVMALNTGHRGSMATVHANSAQDAMFRLETLALMVPNAPAVAVRSQLESAIDVVVQIERLASGRQITEIREVP